MTFPTGPGGADNRVRVSVYRTQAARQRGGDAHGPLLRRGERGRDGEATAEAARAGAATCVKPFTIPDRWIEQQTGSWDPGDTFDMYDNHNNLLANPDIYIRRPAHNYTGYNAQRDKGMQLMIRAGTGNNINPSFYFSFAIGGITGGAEYDWNIANCNTTVMQIQRSAAAGTRQQSGPDEFGHRRPHREGSERATGTRRGTRSSATSIRARA